MATFSVRIPDDVLVRLDAEVAFMGLTRASWLTALIRRRERGAPTFSRLQEPSLIGIHMELRRIAVNITQIVRALNAEATEGRISDPELSMLSDLRQEIRGHMRALRKALEGNLAYWEIAE